MHTKPENSKAGFTLIELMVALVVATIVLAGIYGAYINMYKSQVSQEIKADLQQNARNAIDIISRELMMAGYYGKVYENNVGSVRFSELMKGDAASTQIKYFCDANKRLIRVQGDDDGGAGANWGPETVVAEGVTGLGFSYKDKNNADVTPGQDYTTDSGKAKLKSIRRIIVQVTMQSQKEDPTTGNKVSTVLQASLYPANIAEGDVALDNVAPSTPKNLKAVDNRDCDSLEIGWTANTEPDIAGYYIQYGTQSGVYLGVATVPVDILTDKNNPQYKLTGLIPTRYTDRSSAPTKYYITISAYDSSLNYSSPSTEVSGDPNPDVTAFGGVNDTVVNPKKPTVPTGFATYNMNDTIPGGYSCGENQVRLVWNKSADATVGYRIYRSTTAFTSYPIAPTYCIADEVPNYITKLDSNTITYLDTVPVSCSSYYYAICSINCDSTLVYGEGSLPPLYNSTDYALATHQAKDTTGPPDPDLAGSKGGWKRVFINLVNPVLTASQPDPSTPDFAYTNLYFSDNSMPLLNANGTVTGGQPVYDSSPEPGVAGKFTDPGSSLLNSFVFNSDSRNLDNYGSPELTNDHTYYFLAVAFDKCGNHSSGSATAKTLATLCGDDPAGPPPTPTGVTVSGCGDTMTINWKWPTGPYTEWLDLQGYRVFKNNNGNFSGATDYNMGTPAGSTALLSAPLWGISTPDANVQDGGTYYYCVRATDCIWENIPATDSRYDTIKPNNITPCAPSSIAGPIYPGRINRYSSAMIDNPPAASGDQYNFVESFGVDPTTLPGTLTSTDYHNAVKFYIQNTSAGNVELNKIMLSWGYSTYLKAIIVGGSPGTTTSADYVFSTPISSAEAWSGKTISLMLNEVSSKASGIGAYSSAIPVILVFTNADGTISGNTDMRQDQINVDIQYKNLSTGTDNCISYMDTSHYADPAKDNPPVNVPLGPTMYNSAINVPDYVAFDVPGILTPPHQVTDVHPLAPGGRWVWVQANIYNSELYTYYATTAYVGIKSATLYYAVTDQSATSPGSATFTALPATKWESPYTWPSNNSIFTDWWMETEIPAQDGKRVWYYFKAQSYSGNSYRYPEVQNGYYMYDGAQFDACNVTPMAPNLTARLSGGKALLNWSQVYWYNDWTSISTSDSITYQVYKKIGSAGAWTEIASNLAYPGFGGWTDPTALTQSTSYKVYAKNSCSDPAKGLSLASNIGVVCLGSGCTVTVNPANVSLYTYFDSLNGPYSSKTSVDLTVSICSRAGDGSVWNPADGYDPLSDITMTITSADGTETQNITLYEVNGDSGIFKRLANPNTDTSTLATDYISGYSGFYSSANDPGNLVQGTTKISSLSDTLTYTIDGSITGCSGESATVSVTTNPCSNWPNAPTGLSASVVDLLAPTHNWKYTLNWSAPTTNTDGSSPANVATYKIYYNNDYTHSSPKLYTALTSVTGTSATVTLPENKHGSTKYTYTFYVSAISGCTSGGSESGGTGTVSLKP